MVAKVPAAGVDLTTESSITLKNPATADNSTFTLNLQTAEADIAQDDVLGKINFQAPDEGTGTDAILVAAAIQATSEGDFSSSSNATKLEFMTGSSEAATTQMTISSGGIVGIGATLPGDLGVGLHIKTADSSGDVHATGDELVLENSGDCGMTILSGTGNHGRISFGDSGDNNIGYITYDHGSNNMSFVTNASTQWSINSSGHLLPAATDHGIYLGVNSATASNLLDDYEEGTWTPVWGSTGSYSGQGYDTQSGYYTKIGRQVTIHCYIDLNDAGTVGDFSTIFGLPFTPASTSVGTVPIVLSNTTYPTDHIPCAYWYTGGSARIYLLMCDGGAIDQVAASTVGDDGSLWITATFLV